MQFILSFLLLSYLIFHTCYFHLVHWKVTPGFCFTLLTSSLISLSAFLMLISFLRLICLASDHKHCWVGVCLSERLFSSGATAEKTNRQLITKGVSAVCSAPRGTSYPFWQHIWGEDREACPDVCVSRQTEAGKHTIGARYIFAE